MSKNQAITCGCSSCAGTTCPCGCETDKVKQIVTCPCGESCPCGDDCRCGE